MLATLRALADRNQVVTSLIGIGYYGTHTPGVILRNVLENPAWYTAYTPYQPEISQGRLEALLNFQTMVTDLTGMDIANASMLDERTAAAEAMTLVRRSTKHAGAAVLRRRRDATRRPSPWSPTRAEPLGIELVVGDLGATSTRRRVFGVLLQYPGTSGRGPRPRPDHRRRPRRRRPRRRGHRPAGAARCSRRPASWAPTSCVGSSQRFGVPLGFGGPHAGFLATATRSRGRCPAGWSACRSTPPVAPPTAWPCRPASSTSAARRPRPTSAPRRCCWR